MKHVLGLGRGVEDGCLAVHDPLDVLGLLADGGHNLEEERIGKVRWLASTSMMGPSWTKICGRFGRGVFWTRSTMARMISVSTTSPESDLYSSTKDLSISLQRMVFVSDSEGMTVTSPAA
jgi:hypothetical protein